MENKDLQSLSDFELRKKIVEEYGEGEDFGENFIKSKTKDFFELLHDGDPYSEEYMKRILESESH